MAKDKAKEYLWGVIIFAYCVLLAANTAQVSEGIIKSAERCLNIIIPSLFAFIAVSSIIASSGLYRIISLPFRPIARYILHLPDGLFSVFLLSNIGGYPIGFALLSQMTQSGQISKSDAEKLSCCCYGGGPAFLLGAVGLTVFGSTKTGLLMFASIAISNFIMAGIIGWVYKPKENDSHRHFRMTAQIMTSSVEAAAKSLMKMCAMILFFSTLMSVLESIGAFKLLKDLGIGENGITIIKSLLEISNISSLTGKPTRLIPIITSVYGFGGICVLLQIKSVIGNTVSMLPFLKTRIASFCLQYSVSKIIFNLFADKILAVSTNNANIIVDFNNFIPSICLIMMIFILVFGKRLAFLKEM